MTQFAKTMFPEAKLAFLRGGTYNRVIKLIIDEGARPYVLRWPRKPKLQCRFDADVAVLKYLELHAPSLPVPRVTSHAACHTSPLTESCQKSPLGQWVIHEWLTGEAIEDAFASVPRNLFEDLVQQVTRFFISLYSVRPPYEEGYGMLVATPSRETARDQEVFAYEYDPTYRPPSTRWLHFLTNAFHSC